MVEVAQSKLTHTAETAKLALHRLENLFAVTSVTVVSWKLREQRWVPTGPWGSQQLKEVEVERSLAEREKERVINSAMFSFWLELRDAGKQTEADQIRAKYGALPKKPELHNP